MRKLFVFDLDDTLICNVHDYAKPLLDACWLIVKTLGHKAPHIAKIIAMEQETDRRRVNEINSKTGRPYLWSTERFPGSLVGVYREICRRAKIASDKTIERKLRAIGLRAFDKKQYVKNIIPFTRPVLDFLGEQGDVVFLCSRGDLWVQDRKIAALKEAGIEHFAKAYVVDEKTPKLFAEIAKGFGGFSLYSVGNSYDADILPALEAGFVGIYIPVETWETIGRMDSTLVRVDRKRCIVLQNLEQIKSQYNEIESFLS